MNVLQYKEIVREKLIASPSTRDDDNQLIASVLETLEENIDLMTAKDILNQMKNGKYGCLETIGRSRRYLQQHNEDLRGNSWDKRHKMAKAVAAQLSFNF